MALHWDVRVIVILEQSSSVPASTAWSGNFAAAICVAMTAGMASLQTRTQAEPLATTARSRVAANWCWFTARGRCNDWSTAWDRSYFAANRCWSAAMAISQAVPVTTQPMWASAWVAAHFAATAWSNVATTAWNNVATT